MKAASSLRIQSPRPATPITSVSWSAPLLAIVMLFVLLPDESSAPAQQRERRRPLQQLLPFRNNRAAAERTPVAPSPSSVNGADNAQVAPTNVRTAMQRGDVLMEPQWIWTTEHVPGDIPVGACYFRKKVFLPGKHTGTVKIAADDQYEVYVNGELAGTGSSTTELIEHDISEFLEDGKNVVAVKVENSNGQTAGLAAAIVLESSAGDGRMYLTNPTWRTSLKPWPTWDSVNYRDSRWKPARNLGPFGKTAPWAAPKKRTDLARSAPLPKPPAIEEPSKPRTRPPVDNRVVDSEPVKQPDNFPEFNLRPGFQIQHVAGHDDTGPLLAMAFDEFGQIYASQEGGPLLYVYDTNDNGTPDQTRVACYKVNSCQGILALSGKVYVIAEGPTGLGLYRLEDRTEDGELEYAAMLLKFNGQMGEHGPHGLTLGPDGMIYIAIGNHTDVSVPFAMTSPHQNYYEGELVGPRYEDPRGHAAGIKAPGGGVLRMDLEGQRVELYAGGLRNAYDIAFNSSGDLFTHDSDMESDMGTPWHRPTRVLHLTAGAEFGWRSGWAKWPDYFLDTLPGVIETGRGSPTGCVFYDHNMYPARYQNSFFSCDWSQGEINTYRMDRRGAGFAATKETFLEGKPLNVTDIDVGPDGWLYFCTGGRNTRGNIFRVVWKGEPRPVNRGLGIAKVITQPQLQSAWGRQMASTERTRLGTTWDSEIRGYIENNGNDPELRARAMQLMHLLGPPPTDLELTKWSQDSQPLVRAKAAYLMGLIPNRVAGRRLVEMMADQTAFVRRQACESLARSRQQVKLSDIAGLLGSPDRFESTAARRLLEVNQVEDWPSAILETDQTRLFIQGAAAMLIANPQREEALRVVERFQDFTKGFMNDVDFVDMLRVLQLAASRAGLTPDDLAGLRTTLEQEFPAGNIRINRELSRLLCFLQTNKAIDPMLDYLESSAPDGDKIHVAMHLRFIKDGWSTKQRLRLLRYFETNNSEQTVGKNLSRYVESAAQDFVRTLNADERELVLDRGAEMPSMAVATLFALPESDDLKNFPKLKALDEQIADKSGDGYDQLKLGLVAVIARGGHEQGMEYLREVFRRDPQRRQAVAMGLAQSPGGKNWDYLVRSLPMLEGDSAREVLVQLQNVSFAPELPEHYRQAILVGLRLGENGAADAAKLLNHWTGTTPARMGEGWQAQIQAWQGWYAQKYKDVAHLPPATLPIETGRNTWTFDDLVAFLASEDGQRGSVKNGSQVYAKAQCINCHTHGMVGQNFGPNLNGLARRFQIREVLESIIYPSQVISDQYAAHTIITASGKQLSGLLVPQGENAVKLVPSQGDPVVLTENDIDEVLPNNTSSMPEGLLNSLSLQEIADLFAFLMDTTPVNLAQPGGTLAR